MIKKTGIFLLLCIIAAGIMYLVIPKKILRNIYLSAKTSRIKKRKTEPVLAIFYRDSNHLKINAESFHYFNIKITDFQIKVPEGISNLNKSRPVFITVDMWSLFITENPLESMVKGEYDAEIKDLCSLFLKFPNLVYFRWNPEMEVPGNTYPWQGQSLLAYNAAFKHFSSLCKKWLPKSKIVWSTAGYPGVLDYYPGDEEVDYLGVTLNNESEKSAKSYPEYLSVADEAELKIHRMRYINKPLMLLGQPDQRLSTSVKNQLNVAGEDISKNEHLIYGSISPGIKINSFHSSRKNLSVGVYDPEKKLTGLKEVSLEHLFPNWKDLKDGSFEKEFNQIAARHHDVIVTMEPWREVDGQPEPDVLTNTINGVYDSRINQLFNILSKTKQTVYLRWTHEMEIPVNRYPWQRQPPLNYIKAFRHFAAFKKPENQNIKIVFGPAGDRGLQDYWPGDDIVDFISMAIYGLPDKNITDHKKQLSFEKIFTGKLRRLRFFNKPIIISEFGIKGPEEYQLKWLMNASKTINSHPEIKAVCYFNMSDTPKAWGDIEAPDWRIPEKTFHLFIKSLSFKTQAGLVKSN